MARPAGGEWLGDEIQALRASGVDVLVSLLTWVEQVELELLDEEAWCQWHGLRYISFPIEDRGVPTSHRQTLELLEQLRSLLAAGQQVVIHCRQGVGRSSLVAA